MDKTNAMKAQFRADQTRLSRIERSTYGEGGQNINKKTNKQKTSYSMPNIKKIIPLKQEFSESHIFIKESCYLPIT